MITNYVDNVKTYLGDEKSRYFSHGFKFIDFSYNNLEYANSELKGSIRVKNSWVGKKKKHLHLGTIEFINIVSNICENILSNEYNLTNTELASSWIKDFKIKISKCTDFTDNTTIPFLAMLNSTIKSEVTNFYESSFQIFINETKISINVVHPIFLWFNSFNRLTGDFEVIMNSNNYKLREYNIKDIVISEDLFSCKATVNTQNCNRAKTELEGLFSGILVSDIISISGQLMEVLFYNLYNDNKGNGENIWLKEFYFTNRKPTNKRNILANISFDEILDIKKNEEEWKSIKFSSTMGDMNSIIKVVTRIK